jgi:hypothetical protein
MAKPRLLGISYAPRAAAVREEWSEASRAGPDSTRRPAAARLKSLQTFEFRAKSNPLAAGDPVAHDRWPGDVKRDYGPDLPNLFRFELADRWRGHYSLVGEPGGVRVWVLYLWSHEEYSRQSGYRKK